MIEPISHESTRISPPSWSHVPSGLERGAAANLAQRSLLMALEVTEIQWAPLDDQKLVFVCPRESQIGAAVDFCCQRAQRGGAILLRTPAVPSAGFAQTLLEHHDGICFPKADASCTATGTMITYFGSDVWAFASAFKEVGAGFLRGRGSFGPWLVSHAR
jgi:hypothetical protein